MPVSAIDTLMQIATPPRTAEPPTPPGSGSAFAPALEKAYAADKPREPAPPKEDEEATPADGELASPAEAAVDAEGSGEEQTEETAAVSEAEAPAGEADESEEESSEDEVAISELASAAVASGEAQAAAAAEQVAVATDMLVQEKHVNAAENDESSEQEPASAVPVDAKSEAAESENAVDLAAGVLAKAREDADGSQAKATKREPKAKVAKADDPDAVETNSKPKVAAKQAAATPIAQKTAVEPKIENTEVAELPTGGESTGADTADSKPSKGEEAERLKLPPVEQTAELAAAVERHVAQIEQSATVGVEAAESNSAAPEAASAPPATQRTAATLDRLAAASLRRGDNAATTEGGPAIDRPRFLQRVEGALRAAQQRDGRVQVRLAPPELGSLRIELSVQNGAMTAKLEAETPAARSALLDNLPALRDRLAEQNIRVEKFDVDVRRDSQGGGGNGGLPDQAGDRQDRHSQRRGNDPAQQQAKAPTPRAARTAAATDAGLDVRI